MTFFFKFKYYFIFYFKK